VREAARPLVGAAPTAIAIEPTAAYATAVVLSADGLGDGVTADAVENLFAGQSVATLLREAS
jgi:hypothetical protein